MKKISVSLICFILFSVTAFAQRYAVIDSKYILEKIPEYKDAQGKLDQFSILWQQEIDQKQTALDKLNKEYEAEQIMLPDNLKKKREGWKNAKPDKAAAKNNRARAQWFILELSS